MNDKQSPEEKTVPKNRWQRAQEEIPLPEEVPVRTIEEYRLLSNREKDEYCGGKDGYVRLIESTSKRDGHGRS